MRFSARAWALLSVLLFVAAVLFWRKGNEVEARKRLERQQVPAPAGQAEEPARPAAFDPVSTRGANGMQLASLNLEPLKADSLQNGKPSTEQIKRRFPHRLQNTDKPLNELVKDDGAVLLANALIDTRGQLPEIPRHLRASGDPGSYIVQWNRATDGEFRGVLKEAGAEIISYVPNNAYYVKIDKAGADRLVASAGVQAVMPFEPYYKLDMTLLRFAVEQEPLPAEAMLRLTLLPGTEPRGAVADEVRRLGGEVVGEERSPFGPQLVVRPASGSLVALAQLNEVQGIERAALPKAASDLTRITLGISADGETNANYLGLTGAGTLVNVNDTGIQPNHPAFADTTIHLPAGPLGPWLTAGNDPDGHGTFVASLIAGNGAGSPSAFMTNVIPGTGTNTNTTTNIVVVLPGSTNNPSLRGMAPDADLLMLPLDATGGFAEVNRHVLDSWLVESAAETNYFVLRRTNAPVSNNSWTYGVPSYDSSAARYDAAVRDALPGAPNEQPLLFVFAAGNSGFGQDDGTGGSLDTVESPGTAKNVITVGALEALRLITNVSLSFTNVEYFTNLDGTLITNETIETVYPFAELTDSSTEVAAFSSRGNVGIGIEGDFGRFKPDVVAPGTMLVAARSAGWNFGGFDTNSDVGKLFVELNEHLEQYRFDSGSTFAAANISGMLALIQEYFRDRAPPSARGSLSPALMKALVINGARPVGDYDLAVRSAGNFQGWGLPNLPNSLSSYSTNDHTGVDPARVHLRAIEQSASNAVVTGQSRTWNVTLSTNASVAPLRATLVWTDPPGNPAVGVKLVNDLDLVVTNLDTDPPVVFHGNNFAFGGAVTEPVQLDPGDPEPVDRINNVENIVIRDPSQFGRRFSISVRGKRVNVNAIPDYLNVTRNTNDVAQDFALVVSSDMGADPGLNSTNTGGYLPEQVVFEEFAPVATPIALVRREVTTVTNGLPLLEQRIGANPSLIGTNGTIGQWNFYVFTNITVTNDFVSIRAGSNVAFVTFNPPNLSVPRAIEADIDLYVSTNPALTNLLPSAVAAAFKSRERGGIESVVFTNAIIGQVYYIGVKSEDQQGAEYSFMGVSSDLPFDEEQNGRRVLRGVPLTAAVLDGTARRPTAGTVIGIGLSDRRVANVSVLASTFHENFPDLVGLLSHNQTRAILNNHSFLIDGATFGTNTVYYNDNPMFPTPTEFQPGLSSDGPGSLNDFAGQRIIGPWFLEMIDNTPGHTGRVELVTIYVDPLRDPILFGELITGTVNPNQIAYYPIDVPPNATNLNFRFQNITPSPGGQIDFLWQADTLPTTNQFEFRTNVFAPGSTFSLPVEGGRTYYMGLRNPTAFTVSFELIVTAQFADDSVNRFFARSEVSPVPDAVTLEDVIDVNVDKLVADLQVGVRMKHPRTADMVLSLISPQGTRVLLAENRGQLNNAGFGSTTILTNGFTNGSPIISTQLNYVVFTERTNATVPVKFANPGGSVSLGTIGVPFANDFEGSVLAGNYNQGTTLSAGWTVIDSPADTNTPSRISVINQLSLARSGDTFISLGTAGIQRRFPITVGRPYRLKFYARAAKVLDLYSTGVSDARTPLGAEAPDPHYFLLNGDQTEFPGPVAYVLGPTEPPFTSGLWSSNSAASQWIAPYPRVPVGIDGAGPYVFRTYINMYEQNTATAPIPTFRWWADERGSFVRLNGIVLNYPSGGPTNVPPSGTYGLGGLIPGLNLLDFFVQETNGVEGLRVEVLNGVQPVKTNATMRYVIGGVSRVTPTLTSGWQFFDVPFVPTNALETLQFLTQSGEVWIDTVSIETSGDVYVQPEEPFDILDGERAMGEWRLEVRDARTGAVLPTSEVLEWTLDLTLAETRNPATLAQNGFLDFFELRNDQVHWVILDPCRSASFARLTITGEGNFNEIEMRANWSGFPSGDPEKEDFFPVANVQGSQANGRIVFEINRSLPAPATLRSKPLYVAIYNRFLDATNRYSIDFVSDGDCTPLTPPPVVPPGGAPTPGTVPPNTGGTGTNTTTGLYQFDVGPNIRSATVTVVSDGDVSVFALKDEPPTTSLFSHRMDDINTGGTEVLVIRNPDGSALDPATWFVRVQNDTSLQVNFTISVSFEFITAPGEIRLFLFPLTGGGLRLQWNSDPGVTYEILGADAVTGPWTVLGTITATTPTSSFAIDPSAPQMRFYQVRQLP